MTKIAIFLPTLEGGGAERVCVNLALGFLERGIDLDLVLARAEGPLLGEIPQSMNVVDLKAARVLTALSPLAGYLRREKPDLLISAPDHANLTAIWAKMLAGAKARVAITTHNHLSIVTRKAKKLQEKSYPFLLRYFQNNASFIVAVSKGVADDLAKTAHIPRERISVIYNPVVRPEISELASLTPDFPWPADDKPFILAVGRLSPQKDYPTLLKAFSVFRKKHPARLIILGEGEERQRLEEQISALELSGHVFLPGFVRNPYPFMLRCSLFALSSAWEGFSMVIAEALYCGAQIVSTDCPSGPAEILENGRYGRLVPVGDENALATALEAALDHPMPVEGLKVRAADFSNDAAVSRYLGLLEDLK